ncbi:MAG: flagellar M-ring protein FliF [Treponema sp.]|nr:flagellar M-ring protein FliF [Treponema sp.]MBQ5632753.1 flagellar M-ring protein FliF [Treponema sp.]MBQ5646617.1 flagellar M-ring protein FliF [Treponema sp.]
MNEWLKKMIDKTKEFWKNSSIVKKVILIGIIVAIIGAIVVATNVSSKPTTVKLFNAAVTDETLRSQILDRISQENIEAFVSDDGYISVLDDKTARKMRSILVTEGLTPSNVDIFEGFYNRSWSTTDKEQNIRLKNLITQNLKMHLESLSDISSANVTLVLPENELFASDQKPVSASVILNIKPSSNLANERKRLLGIQKLILSAVEGLTAENLTISDMDGNVLNDFEGMADMDRVSVIERQQKLRRKLEAQLKADVLIALQKTKTEDRIRDLNVTIDMDMSEKSNESTIYTPIEMKADNKDTPYDESAYVEGLPISQQTVTKEWQGTGYNPEGPAGVEGQNPPVYSDMSNVIGKSTETGVTQNNAVNTTHTKEKVAPRPGRVTVSVNIDGEWKKLRDPKTHTYMIDEKTGSIAREYIPVSSEELLALTNYVKNAVGYKKDRGDEVTVTNIKIDRSAQFAEEDEEYFKKQQTRRTILLVLISIAVVLVGFILFRIISKEIERRKRLREEELLRQQQAAREQALWNATDESGVQVTMSVEESRRAELQENAINMAKEHPEDVAMLIRTWLMEE